MKTTPAGITLPEDEPCEWVQGEVLQLQEDGGQGEAGQGKGGEARKVREMTMF